MTDYDRMQAVLQKVHVLAGQGQPLPPDLLAEWRDLNARLADALTQGKEDGDTREQLSERERWTGLDDCIARSEFGG